MSYGKEFKQSRREALKRDDEECQLCGVSDEQHVAENNETLHAHHIIPRENGGSDSTENLLIVCSGCHQTLENAHARVVAEKLEEIERLQDDLNHVHGMWKQYDEKTDEFQELLAEFVEDHPIFAQNIHAEIQERGGRKSVNVPNLEHYLGSQAGKPTSEFEFAAMFGYRLGLIQAVYDIEEYCHSPFEQSEVGGKSDT